MAGFLIEEFTNVQITTATTTNLFTVTALHGFIIKSFFLEHTENSATSTTAKTFSFELSDAAGANFIKVTPNIITGATVGEHVIQLASDTGSVGNTSAIPQAITATALGVNFFNTSLASGQILRVVSSGAYASPDSTDIKISGIDHTE